MDRVTNMCRRSTPFAQPPCYPGAGMVTVVALSWTGGGLGIAYLTVDRDDPPDLGARPSAVRVDYEVLRPLGTDSEHGYARQLAAAVEGRVRHSRADAALIAAHEMGPLLERVLTEGEDQPESRQLLAQWRVRASDDQGGQVRVVDTATDLADSDLDLRGMCSRAGIRSRHLDSVRQDSVRVPITTALAVALLAGRSRGLCSWPPILDLDLLVAAAAARRDTAEAR